MPAPMAATMRAWQVRSPGPMSAHPLELVERPRPEPGQSELLVRVRAEVREDPRAIRRLTLMNQGVREPDASYLAAAP